MSTLQRTRNLLFGIGFAILTWFAPMFIGVTYVTSLYDTGALQLQFMYVIPLIDYGLRDFYSWFIFFCYVVPYGFLSGWFILRAIHNV